MLHGSDALFELEPPAARVGKSAASYITSYLQVLPGVGPKARLTLAARGIYDLADIIERPEALPAMRRHLWVDLAHQSLEAIDASNPSFFLDRLPRSEHWRLAVALPKSTTFLDIETTGLSRMYHQLTVIGWAQEGQFHASVGQPSREQIGLLEELFATSVLVTYNGAHFDVPFLRHHIPSLNLPLAHVDLRHLGQRLGLTGGQKKVEEQLGLEREGDLKGLDGSAAPALWFQHNRGDKDALALLLKYNHADVEGLRLLLQAMASRMNPNGLAVFPESIFDDWSVRAGLTGGAKSLASEPLLDGPRLTLDLLQKVDNLRVVGIDLSGGPKSVTGWAQIRGAESETAALRADEEILQRTLDASPHVVSIDAPLSLPFGRTRVTDDDPARQEFGITRASERELRRRGVNTYPALIRSMQALTARGIVLASNLRDRGIPVIESFPGAMQDILGMPRKGLSLSALKESLREYGLAGEFLDKPVTHDEIDALSSAIVGQLFWEGKFEPLGVPEENYMIVPDVTASPAAQHIVGLAGRFATGKTTLAVELENRGYLRLSYSEVLKDLFPNPDGPTDRTYLRHLGARVHEEYGQRWLSDQVAQRATGSAKVVIDGVRYPADRAYLVETFGSAYEGVFLSANESARRQRYAARLDTQDSFPAAAASATERRIDELQTLAERTFDNSGSVDRLAELAEVLAA